MNIKKTGNSVLLAVCDAEIIGRTLRKGKVVFHVKEEFYKGTKASIGDAIALIENSTMVNLIGKNIVQRAIEKGYVHPEAVLNIEGIPHAQIVKV